MEAPVTPNTDDDSSHADDVAVDHSLHWLAVVGAAAYAWKLHGLLVAAGTFVGLLIAISVTNMILLAMTGSFRLIRVNRWSWVILAFVLLAASGASVGRV